jgi:UDP-GlcNAc3NAcA epimerase
MHRPSNVDDPRNLANILNAIIDISEKHDLDIIFPVHPRTKNVIEHLADKVLSKKILNHKNIKMLPPASFIEMIALEKYSEIVITDSGGVQKEAFFLERPCLIMLEETPWVELIDSGCAKLVGSDKELIKDEFDNFYLNGDKLLYENLYGDGNSSNFILNKIVECNLLK